MKIISKKKLPNTTNAWGFAGSTNKIRFVMENGDVWVAGTAQFKHAAPVRYIQIKHGPIALIDENLKGSAEKYIEKYYQNKNNWH